MSEKNIAEDFDEIMKDVPKEVLDQMCPYCSKMKVCACTEKMPQWISLKERLPVEYEYVLLLAKQNEKERYDPLIFVGCKRYNYWECAWGDGWTPFLEDDISHWMPLPKPPKE